MLVELLAFDPVLPTVPRRVPFLLPGHETATRQLDVQDGLVRRYGRAAWSTDGAPRWTTPSEGAARVLTLRHQHGEVRARWLLRDPATVYAAADRLRAGAPADWNRDVIARPVIGADHRFWGFVSRSPHTDTRLPPRPLRAHRAARRPPGRRAPRTRSGQPGPRGRPIRRAGPSSWTCAASRTPPPGSPRVRGRNGSQPGSPGVGSRIRWRSPDCRRRIPSSYCPPTRAGRGSTTVSRRICRPSVVRPPGSTCSRPGTSASSPRTTRAGRCTTSRT
ncbi:hypothetical protein IHE61_27165 [Streptomyces sp. GKU 257-1]|nr:hypothetical protein [Streptomyces sp. GKU 257-1]